MTPVFGAAGANVAAAFLEIGALALALSLLALVAARLGVTAIPLYLLAGLAVGEGGLVRLDVSDDFIALVAEIGVLLLLLALGLEYSGDELRRGLRTGLVPGLIDASSFLVGGLAGLALGWEPISAALLGGVTWVTSSGVTAKVLSDLGRLGNRETPAVLNLLVIEDLAMGLYLPLMAALIAGSGAADTLATVAIALVVVAGILWVAMQWGPHLSRLLSRTTDEALLLAIFGITLLVAGLAQQVEVSAAIGAFLVGLALSGSVQERASVLVHPLRDLFAAVFFVSFSFQIRPDAILKVLGPAVGLAVLTSVTKLAAGWVGAARVGVGVPGRVRAGTALIARGEFSIVIAALGAGTANGADLGALAAGYVLLTAVLGPVAARYADALTTRFRRPAAPPPIAVR